MPSKAKFSQEQIIDAGLEIVRREGFKALTARALAQELNSSPRPIFTVFDSMEEVREELLKRAVQIFLNYQNQEINRAGETPYKGSGIGYIRFAREEKELFKTLFMDKLGGEEILKDGLNTETLIEMIQNQTGLSKEKAERLHLEMWIYVHGIAVMLATNYLDLDLKTISEMLTDGYQGISGFLGQKGKESYKS